MTDMYAYPVRDDSIAQGDIFFDCLIHLAQPTTGNTQDPMVDKVFSLQQVIVLTQSCDLAQAKITHVVVAPILPAEEYVRQGLLKPAQIRDQVRTGRMFGLYFLPASERPGILCESIVDLRVLHSVHRSQLESLITASKRPARLVTPFREHLAQHFAVTYMRIALPDPYPTNPSVTPAA